VHVHPTPPPIELIERDRIQSVSASVST